MIYLLVYRAKRSLELSKFEVRKRNKVKMSDGIELRLIGIIDNLTSFINNRAKH